MDVAEADRLTQQAAAALNAGQVAPAHALAQRALQHDPRHLMARCVAAEAALLQKDHITALALADAALRLEPFCAPAVGLRARALWLAGRRAEAGEAAARAMDLQPSNPAARLLAVQFLAWTGQAEKARVLLVPLLDNAAPSPAYAAALAMAGECAIAEGRFQDADAPLMQALQLQPNLATARVMLGMNLLRQGRFEEGWQAYGIRDRVPALNVFAAEALPGRFWQGEDLSGRSLLVTDDQGHGDAIQFWRYAPLLLARGPSVLTWRTFPPLVRLFGASGLPIKVLAALPPDAAFDFHCPSTALPRLLNTTPGTIRAPARYLQPAAHLRSALRLPVGRERRVGLVWSGDPRHARDHLRSVAARDFLRLADVPGISVHSLQHAVRADDVPALKARQAVSREIEKAADFADTASLIDRLDLVVTVDTAIAHLAAALGKPAWVVLHVSPDWRWMAERQDSPWYPTIRLFRVRRSEWNGPHDPGWGPVLGRVAAALRDWAGG